MIMVNGENTGGVIRFSKLLGHRRSDWYVALSACTKRIGFRYRRFAYDTEAAYGPLRDILYIYVCMI